jgi:hypothetical protein
MSDARVEIKIGSLEFCAEGSEQWVNEKYNGFLSRAQELKGLAPLHREVERPGVSHEDVEAEQPVGPLAIFLKEKNVGASQNNRFLATAVWLKRKGQATPKTPDVVKALADAQQQRLGNPADILNQNVKKGYCVKTADGFYVTPEGEESLG